MYSNEKDKDGYIGKVKLTAEQKENNRRYERLRWDIRSYLKSYEAVSRSSELLGERVLDIVGIDGGSDLVDRRKALHKILKEYKDIREKPEASSGVYLYCEYILNDVMYYLVDEYVTIFESKHRIASHVESLVEEHPLWEQFFSAKIPGCNKIVAAEIIYPVNIRNSISVSSLWRYSGIGDYNIDGQRVNMNKVEDSRFNEGLKHAIMGELIPDIVDYGDRYNDEGEQSEYYQYYMDAMEQINSDEKWGNATYDVKKSVAYYKVAKKIVLDLWITWRKLYGYSAEEFGARRNLNE